MKTIITCFVLSLIASNAVGDDRPNIVLIIADDVGRDWVSCYGAKHQTPNIDRLAEQGIRYETAWCMPVGTPTRVTLLTGQYPFRHGWTGLNDRPLKNVEGLNPKKFTTFARVLRDAGYATAIAGQWKVNDLGKHPDVLKEHGFDEHCLWIVTKVRQTKTEKRFSNGRLITNGKTATVRNGLDTINAFLIDFVARQKKGHPFLVYYPMLLTHEPETTAAESEDKSTDKTTLFARNVSHMDQSIGKLVRAVDQSGHAKNTLVIFTSDNGSAIGGTLNNQRQPKGKGSPTDYGAHVPFIVRAPFLTSGGRISRDLIDLTDLYPTFLELANVKRPERVQLDGNSFVRSLQGSDDPFEKRNWIYSQLGELRMIRDWHHILDNQGNFHDLDKDPLQKSEVSVQDKQAPHRRQRLQMILDRFPLDPAGAKGR
jgi:arylsulfatase A-like enzyme